MERLNDLLKRSQAGDADARQQLLQNYRPYILKTASKICKRFIDSQKDDEFSIALLAFNEAIDAYDESHKASFVAFSERVIRNRLIDYFRKEQVFRDQIPFSSLASNEEQYDEVQNRIDASQSLDEFSRQQMNEARKLEIEEFQLLLADFSVTISDLVQLSPKHDDSRQQLIEIARQLAADKHIVEKIINTRKLPLNEMAEKLTVSRKTLERHRKYLIALTIILTDAFPYMRSFLKFTEKEGVT